MKFIENGPNIKQKLITEHLNGNVVFICGAGISMNAEMPNYETLYNLTVKKIGISDKDIAETKGKPTDFKFQHLEDNCGRESYIRNIVKDILFSCQNKKEVVNKNLETHKAILKLSRNTNGLHLVTTNYDNLFEQADDINHKIYSNHELHNRFSNWDGLVYVHGTLGDINNIVLTSDDFGREYTGNGKVVKFLKRLIQKYYICFIGYSLDDLMMKYFLGSLDKKYKDRIYAFLEDGKTNKNVTVISYNPDNKHFFLHETIKRWAEFYDDVQTIPCKYINKYKHINPNKDSFHTGKIPAILKCNDLRFLEEFCLIKPYPPYEWFDTIVSLKQFYTRNSAICRYVNNKHNQLINSWLSNFADRIRFVIDLIKKDLPEDRDLNRKIRNRIRNFALINHSQKRDLNVLLVLWELYIQKKISYWPSNLFVRDLAKDASKLEELSKLIIKISEPAGFKYYGSINSNDVKFRSTIEFKYFDAYEALESLKREIIDNAEQSINIFENSLNSVLHPLKKLYSLKECNSMTREIFSSSPNHYPERSWIIIIKLICDCWYKISLKDTDACLKLYKKWILSDDIVFNRIALHLASSTEQNTIPVNSWYRFLIKNGGEMLLNENLKYEIDDLLLNKSTVLNHRMLSKITSILKNNSNNNYCVYLRLKSIKMSGCNLDNSTLELYCNLENIYGDLHSPVLISHGDGENNSSKKELPNDFNSLLEYFTSKSNDSNWRLFISDNPLISIELFKCALCKGVFKEDIFQIALNEWSYGNKGDHVFELIKVTADFIPPELLIRTFSRLASFAYNKKIDLSFELVKNLSNLLNRIIDNDCLKEFHCDYYRNIFDGAINDAFGLYANVLSNFVCAHKSLNQDELDTIFNDLSFLCNQDFENLYYSRIAIAENICVFYNTNKDWFLTDFMPLLSWDCANRETAGIWSAFCKSITYIPELLDEIKETTCHYKELYNPEDYCYLIFHLYISKILTDDDVTNIFNFAKQNKGLLDSFSTGIYNWIKSCNINSNAYKCKTYVIPFVVKFWPKFRKYLTDTIVTNLFLLIIHSGNYFKDAFISIGWALRKIKFPGRIIEEMSDSNCCSDFPEESLRLLNAIINDDIAYSVDSIDFDGIDDHVSSYKNIKDLVEKYRSRTKNS